MRVLFIRNDRIEESHDLALSTDPRRFYASLDAEIARLRAAGHLANLVHRGPVNFTTGERDDDDPRADGDDDDVPPRLTATTEITVWGYWTNRRRFVARRRQNHQHEHGYSKADRYHPYRWR